MDGLFITIPLFLADKHPYVKTAISLPDLIRETNAFSKKYRAGCVPKLLDSNPKALFLHYNVKCNKTESDPAGHDVRIQFDVTKVQESQKAKDLDVQVSCSCPAFLYWGAQWNLHQRDGLLGQPRPKLIAPTERLDLRANYVICKHCHAVLERVLPSVQHNIVNILREREVQRNKDKVRKTPERLKRLQEEVRLRQEKEKIRKIKDKDVRNKALEALKSREQERRMHEQELENQGKAPGGAEPALEPGELEITRRVPEEALPEETGEERDLSDIQDLVKQEESKIKELHEEGKPHVHKGLPYDIESEEEDRLIRKFESLHLSRLAATSDKYPQFKKGDRVRHAWGGDTGTVAKQEIGGRWRGFVTVIWDDSQELWPVRINPLNLELESSQTALRFAGKKEESVSGPPLTWDDVKPGVRVFNLNWPTHKGTINSKAKQPWDYAHVRVTLDTGAEVSVPIKDLGLMIPQQQRMFAAKLKDIAVGDRVWFDSSKGYTGIVLEIRRNKKHPDESIVKVDWEDTSNFTGQRLGIVEVPLRCIVTQQQSLFQGVR